MIGVPESLGQGEILLSGSRQVDEQLALTIATQAVQAMTPEEVQLDLQDAERMDDDLRPFRASRIAHGLVRDRWPEASTVRSIEMQGMVKRLVGDPRFVTAVRSREGTEE